MQEPKAVEEPEEVDAAANALCWVCGIGGDILDLHENRECQRPNQLAHTDCWKSWVQERKTEILKSQCPDCETGWKLMRLLEEQQKRPVFDDHTGAEIRGSDSCSLINDERTWMEDIKNALTILYSQVAKNNLTPRNKDLLRLVGFQFLGEWSKWIK